VIRLASGLKDKARHPPNLKEIAMSASICLSFNEGFSLPSYRQPSAISALIDQKQQAAMKEALEILCGEVSSRSEIQEILDSVKGIRR